MIDCKYQDILDHIDNVCDFVASQCDYSYVNFLALHYCDFEEKLFLTLPVVGLLTILCFFLLSDTSNKYLSPSLTFISDSLRISQSLAGLTFLAFGNGAPDVISSIVAAGDSDGSIDFSVGALMGAGVFVSTVVLSTVVLLAGTVKVDKVMFTRDIILYLLTLLFLTLFSLDGIIELWESICFFSIYILYVLVGVIQDRLIKNKDQVGVDKQEKVAEDLVDNMEIQIVSPDDTLAGDSIVQSNAFNDSKYSTGNIQALSNSSLTTLIKDDYFYDDRVIASAKKHLKTDRTKAFIQRNYSSIYYRFKKHYFQHIDTKWEEKGVLGKIFYCVIEFPFTLVRDLTIPPCEKEKWNRTLLIPTPFCSTLFIVLSTGTYLVFVENLYLLISTILVLTLLSVVIAKCTYRNRLPKYLIIFAFFNFVISIFWIWFISEILVNLLKVFGVIFNIPEAFLGMTLLTLGNSAPDLSVNCALARSGYGEMGLAGSIAGPLFNVLVGLGITFIKKNIEKGDLEFKMFNIDKNIILFISLVVLTFNLLRLLIQSWLLKFKLTSSIAYFGYVVYLGFCAAICFFVFT